MSKNPTLKSRLHPSSYGYGQRYHSHELGETAQPDQHRYEGPCKGPVYSPLPLSGTEKLIGESDALYRLFDLVASASRTNLNVFIRGEVGTGKSLVAKTIHSHSDRSKNWLIVVNCDLIQAEDLKPILLGSAPHSTKGVLEAANGGTVVFDHVDQLDFKAQAHLNHFLESHTFAGPPARQSEALAPQFLFIATSPLSHDEFKRGLYDRINQFPIQVPPLRAHDEDIIPLADHFLCQRYRRAQSDNEKNLSERTKTVLQRYDWPGNVRELQSAMLRAVDVSNTSTIEVNDLPSSVRQSAASTSQEGSSTSHEENSPKKISETPVQESSSFFIETDEDIPEIEEIKRKAVKRAYNLCDGDIDRAAVELGIARSTMYRLLERYGLK